jgi:hypothetical protein
MMTIDITPDRPSEAADEPPPPMLQAAPADRVETSPSRSRRRGVRRTALRALSFAGKAAMIAMAAMLFLIVLAFVIDDPDPVRSPSQSASMRY